MLSQYTRRTAITLALTPLLLTGCSLLGDKEDADNNSGEVAPTGSATMATQNIDPNSSDPMVATRSIVKKLSDFSNDSKNGLSIAGRNAQNILGAEHSSALQQTVEAQSQLRALPADVQQKLAQNYSDYDVLSLYYDMTGVSPADSVILSMYMMGVSATFSATPEPITNITAPDDAIVVTGNTATLDLKQATYDTAKNSGRKLPIVGTGAPTTLHFNKVGEQWLISGQNMITELANINSQQP